MRAAIVLAAACAILLTFAVLIARDLSTIVRYGGPPPPRVHTTRVHARTCAGCYP
jgi:hypothetical protein